MAMEARNLLGPRRVGYRPPLLTQDRPALRSVGEHSERFSLPPAKRPRMTNPYSDFPVADDPYSQYGDQPDGNVQAAEPEVVCEVIVLDIKQRLYGETVKGQLIERGIATRLRILTRAEGNMLLAIQEAVQHGLLFACSVNEQNELHKSITVHILQGIAQEHRNMPLTDALALVEEHFVKFSTTVSDKHPVKPPFTPPNENIRYLLNLVLDKRFLAVNELDEILDYFEKRRDQMALAQGMPPKTGKQPLLPEPCEPSEDKVDMEAVYKEEQQKLQEKIYNILTGKPVEDESLDAPISGLSGSSGAAAAETAEMVQNVLKNNPALKSFIGIRTSQSATPASSMSTSTPALGRMHASGPVLQPLRPRMGLPRPPGVAPGMPGVFNGRPRLMLPVRHHHPEFQ